MRSLYSLLIASCLLVNLRSADVIIAWEPQGFTNTPTDNQGGVWNASTSVGSITIPPQVTLLTGFTRATGVNNHTSVNNTWGGKTDATSKAEALSTHSYFYFTLSPSGENTLSLYAINFNLRRYNGSYQWQYSTDGSTFKDIGSAVTINQNSSSFDTNGTVQAAVSLADIPELQNLSGAVTLRVLAWNTSTPFAIGRLSGPDLVLVGSLHLDNPDPDADIPISQFDAGVYYPWTVEGSAFGSSPVNGVASSANAGDETGYLKSTEFIIQRPYINLALAGGRHLFRTSVNLWVNGEIVRTSTGNNSDTLTELTWDVSEFAEASAQVEIVDLIKTPVDGSPAYIAVRHVTQSQNATNSTFTGNAQLALRDAKAEVYNDISIAQKRAALDPRRPTYHFMPVAQRMNDPNAPFYKDGVYHLFYQHNVYSDGSGDSNMMWGHATSTDLVSWTHQPLAIFPDRLHGEEQCYSGTAVFQKNGDPMLLYTFVGRTGVPREQWAAIPSDRSYLNWERHPQNPVLSHTKNGGTVNISNSWRDPFVFEADGKQFMLLTNSPVSLFEADDDTFMNWTHKSGSFYTTGSGAQECPNFFQLPYANGTRSNKWLYMVSPQAPVAYALGSFDSATASFSPEQSGNINHNQRFYATQGLYHPEDGRLLIVAIIKGFPSANGWRDCLIIPRQMHLAEDGTLRQHPINEITALRSGDPTTISGFALNDESRPLGISGDVMELLLEITPGTATSYGVKVRVSEDGSQYALIQHDIANGKFMVYGDQSKPTDGSMLPINYTLEDRKLHLRIFLDKGALEVFTQDGKLAESRYCPLDPSFVGIEVFAENGTATLDSATAWGITRSAQNNVTLFDFEEAVYGDNWTKTGTAFDVGPQNAAASKVTNHHGQQVARSRGTSGGATGDNAMGTLTSPEFVISHDFLRFLVGGGKFPGETEVQLLINGETLRSVTGHDSSVLREVTWDLRSYLGQVAQIRLYDNKSGSWGHITADYFVLTNQQPEQDPNVKALAFTPHQDYLVLPIKNSAPRTAVRIAKEGNVVRYLTATLAEAGETPDWYASVDVSEWLGEELTLVLTYGDDIHTRMNAGERFDTVPDIVVNDPGLASLVSFADEPPLLMDIYQEPARPRFHYTAPNGRLNDPNGLSYFDGKYRLFYQYAPYSVSSAEKHWGYASSTDLFHWETHDPAILPSKHGMAFSGSGVVDHNNTSGLAQNGVAPLVLTYTVTASPRYQAIAYSYDGLTFHDHPETAVTPQAYSPTNRDPKVIWHEGSQQWIMALYAKPADKHTIHLLGSPDLQNYSLLSVIEGDEAHAGYLAECPDFFPLTDSDNSTLWVAHGANGQYTLGNFDGSDYTPVTPVLNRFQGTLYASQSFDSDPQNRRVQIGWMNSTPFEGSNFSQSLSLPTQLSLKQTPQGPRIASWPVQEIEQLRSATLVEASEVALENNQTLPFETESALFDVLLSIDPKSASTITLDANGTPIIYDAEASTLSCASFVAPVSLVEGKLKLRILADRGILDIFADEGLAYIAVGNLPVNLDDTSFKITASGGEATIETITLYALDSSLPTLGSENITLFDFEEATYGDNWALTGTAFSHGPQNAVDSQVTLHHGLQVARSRSRTSGDGDLGTLTSPGFLINRNFISFLVGGGNYPGETEVQLLVNGEVVRSVTGHNSNALRQEFWDVSAYKNQRAQIRLLDNKTGSWGHICADYFVLTNAPVATIPSPYFADHMVLQRNLPIPVWGSATPGDPISVTLANSSGTIASEQTVTDSAGNFFVTLPAQDASAIPHTLTIAGAHSVTFSDILIGDLWLCGGQSNMARKLSQVANSATEIADITRYPHIRYYQATRTPSLTPVETNSGTWHANNSTELANATAVGYFFARTLSQTALQGVPIGLLDINYGGSAAEAWMERETLRRLGFTDYANSTVNNNKSGATLYNAMIHPIRHVSLSGILWYQGEQNADRPSEYAALFSGLISHWRDVFQNPELPFYFVQLANYNDPGNSTWPELREAQAAALALPNTGMAVTIDIGNDNDIHPTNKQDVGTRLALLALNNLFGVSTLEHSGPAPLSAATLGDGNVSLSLSNATSLILDATKYKAGMPAFELAGDDEVFHPAEVSILSNDGDSATLRLFSANVSAPKQVRYAWHNTPSVPLYNTSLHPVTQATYALPAAPFRMLVSEGPNLAELSEDELIAYAFTANGATSANGSLVHIPVTSVSEQDNTLQISFAPANPRLQYEVQESTDLRTWTTIQSIPGGSSVIESVKASSNASLSPKLFLRVRVRPLSE